MCINTHNIHNNNYYYYSKSTTTNNNNDANNASSDNNTNINSNSEAHELDQGAAGDPHGALLQPEGLYIYIERERDLDR